MECSASIQAPSFDANVGNNIERGVNQYYQIKHFFISIFRFIFGISVKENRVYMQLRLMQQVYIQ